jgi:sugar phosphate isomerase/epimerase
MALDLSFQMYSGRNFPLDVVLDTIAELGYLQAEGYGGLFDDPAGLKARLDQRGLTMPTAHIGLDMLEDGDRALDIAATLGTKVRGCIRTCGRPMQAAGRSSASSLLASAKKSPVRG